MLLGLLVGKCALALVLLWVCACLLLQPGSCISVRTCCHKLLLVWRWLCRQTMHRRSALAPINRLPQREYPARVAGRAVGSITVALRRWWALLVRSLPGMAVSSANRWLSVACVSCYCGTYAGKSCLFGLPHQSSLVRMRSHHSSIEAIRPGAMNPFMRVMRLPLVPQSPVCGTPPACHVSAAQGWLVWR